MGEERENSIDTKRRGKVFVISPPSYLINAQYYAAIAENLGYEVRLNETAEAGKTFIEIKSFKPDFLIMRATFEKFRTQLEFLDKLKQSFPSIKVIVTGEPFLTYNNNVTYENPYIDYAIMGEAEYAIKDILDGVPDCEVLGICYSNEYMQSIKNEQRPCIENLDDLPFPARHLSKKNKFVTIEVSRGCPCHCFFCLATPINSSNVRMRSTDSIIKEIKECIEKFDTKNIFFKADLFNFDRAWVNDLCKKIIENNIKIKWSCDIVPNNVDGNMIKLMKESGCELCKLGIESGSPDILSKIGKNINQKSIKQTVDLLKKYKIKTKGYFIIGLPWETEDTAEETINFAKSLKLDDAIFNIGVPFPGTKFFIHAMLNKLFPAQTQFMNSFRQALVKSHKLSKERIAELRILADKKLHPDFLWQLKDIWKQLIKKFSIILPK